MQSAELSKSFNDLEHLAAIGWARRDIYAFSRWIFLQRKGYRWIRGPHHQVICNALMKVYRGESTRLIINVPPRYSKTELAVINFITWGLGKVPDAEFIYSSYSARLATTNSWTAREIVQYPEYQRIFPLTFLNYDSKARDEWRTSAGGCVYAVGTGGSITGYGAGKMRPGFGGAIILDDVHKADEARSDVMRRNVIDWFQNTLESRKNSPHTPIILIMQRLHEEDLAGFLLAGGNGEAWDHISLPAIQEDGTALWPEKHPLEKLQTMQQASPYTFAGQYMQSPSSPEGNIFKPDQLKIVDAVPASVNIDWVRGWDLAATTDGNFTAGALLGRLADRRWIIADMARFKRGPDERDAAMRNITESDGRNVRVDLPQDPGQAGKTQVIYLTKSLEGYSVRSSPESGDKITRAEPFAAQVNVGNVLMLRGEWNRELINEMRMFPNGKYTDQIDALSRAFARHIAQPKVTLEGAIFTAGESVMAQGAWLPGE